MLFELFDKDKRAELPDGEGHVDVFLEGLSESKPKDNKPKSKKTDLRKKHTADHTGKVSKPGEKSVVDNKIPKKYKVD